MISELIILILMTSLVIIQSIAGVGILVVGTPILLFLNFSMIETMNFLLPISILTSLLNILFIKFKNKLIYYNFERLKYFFVICVPFVLLGLIILKYSNEIINYDYLVSFIIILTLIYKKKISIILKSLSSNLNKIILMIIGIVHGMTNSGGTLLSIFLINTNNTKKESRSEITIFYFFLALLQFILFAIIFGFTLDLKFYYLKILCVFFGVFLGNLIIKYIKDTIFRKIIFILALLSSVSLLLKNILIF